MRTVTERTKRALLVLGSLLLSLIVFGTGCELFLRSEYRHWRGENEKRLLGGLYIASENPRLVWESRPGFTAEDFTINRWGFRDVDSSSKKKPPGVHRIAFVGDSVTMGRVVKRDELFTSLIGSNIAPLPSDGPVQPMNFAVSGYNALQIVELVRAKVLDFEPDEVVYAMCLNDFDLGLDDASGQIMRYFRPPKSFLWERLQRGQSRLTRGEYHRLHFSKNHEEVFEAIERLNRELDEHRIAFQVAILPIFDVDQGSFQEYKLGDVHDAIQRILTEKRIRNADLLPAFRECSKLPPWAYAFDVWHLNVVGHRFVARALSELLRLEGAPRHVSDGTCADLLALEPADAAGAATKFESELTSGAEVQLAIDSPLLRLEEFWPIERDSTRVYAWSRGRSAIDVSHVRPGASYRIRLLVADSAGRVNADAGPKNGTLERVVLEGSAFRLPVPIAADETGHVTVELRVPTFQPSARGLRDDRELGMAVSGVAVRAAP
jgi:hypothetical protein